MPMNPPMAAKIAKITSGNVITGGDSCACEACSDFSLPEKTTKNKSERVKRRQSGDENRDAEQQIIFLFQALRENGIFGIETGERRNSAQRERADEKCPERNRHFLCGDLPIFQMSCS